MADHDTVFGELLRLVSRRDFEQEARRHDKRPPHDQWIRFVAMAMAQLTAVCSLPDVEGS